VRRKQYLDICLIVALIMFIVACASKTVPEPGAKPAAVATTVVPAKLAKAEWQQKWETVVEEAKKEGEIRVYTSIPSEARVALGNGFKEKFGIPVEFVTGLPADIVAKLVRERRANLYLADAVIEGASSQIVNLKGEGILDPLEPALILPEVTDPKVWRAGQVPFIDRDKRAIGFIGTLSPFIVRNRDLVKAGEISSYRDILNPRWKGKIVMFDPTTPGPMATFFSMLAACIWDEARTKEFMQELVRQEPFITRDNRLQVEWVSRGKYAISLGSRPEIATQFQSEGAPIEDVRAIEGNMLLAASGCISMPNNAPHPKAAQVFVNWLLSKEGQIVFAKGFFQPSARLDVSTEGLNPMFIPKPGEKLFIEAEDNVLLRARMMQIAKEIMAPLMK
jgi:iron(III) transport system substrate-binding protein